MKGSLKKPLMTRVGNVDYDRENKKGVRKRLVHLEGAGWLTDEDLAALDPDELVRDYDKSEIVRLGDLRVYKSARRKAGLPPLEEDRLKEEETKRKRTATIKAKKDEKREEAELDTMKDSLHGFLGEQS
jgi:hypothetical protein